MIGSNLLPASIRIASVAALLSLATASSSYASDSDRITLLEKEVQELKLRLLRLESTQADTGKPYKPVASSDGWKNLANWRSLKKGMSFDEVRGTLGEPARVQGGNFTFWYYLNRGTVTFYEDKLHGWTEPM